MYVNLYGFHALLMLTRVLRIVYKQSRSDHTHTHTHTQTHLKPVLKTSYFGPNSLFTLLRERAKYDLKCPKNRLLELDRGGGVAQKMETFQPG